MTRKKIYVVVFFSVIFALTSLVVARSINPAQAGSQGSLKALSRFFYPIKAAAQTDADTLIAEQLIALRDHLYEEVLAPGWLHIRSQVSNFSGQPMGSLPDGRDIPGSSTADDWYLIDEQGFVSQAVSLMVGEDGDVLQAAVYQDGVWHNLTFAEQHEQLNFSIDREFIDGGFASLVSSVITDDTYIIDQESIQQDGREFLVFSLATPVASPPYPQDAVQFVKRAIYDAQTRLLISIQTLLVLEDDSEVVYTQMQLLLIENSPMPPGEVTSYLEH